MMTSPPRPPSPPSGPPMGTNFSRRNELAPDPPVPASTRTTTRSMNMYVRCMARLAGRSVCPHALPESLGTLHVVRRQHVAKLHQQRVELQRRRSGVERTVQVRVQLSVLPQGGAGGHDAQLPS